MVATSGLPPTLSFQVLTRSRDQQVTAFQQQPTISRNLEAFQANAANITTVDQLLDDRRSLEVVLSSFQLEDQINSRALIRKILTEPPDERGSLANRLLDPRYRTLADSLQGLAAGERPFSDPSKVAEIAAGYIDNEFEKAVGENTPGIREALFFRRNIGGIESLNQLLADPTLKEVARVAVGLPEDVGALDFEQQRTRFDERIDIEKFKDEKFVDAFLRRYLIRIELEQPQFDPITSLVTSIRPFGVPGNVNIVV